jgi:carbon-monoxide dehydrogenase small subunit
VSIDGEPARACLAFAATCSGATVTTIEGFDDDPLMAELRQAFNREHALQCGYCTPGMLVTARDLALRLPDADERRIRIGLAGNLCRCTGYAGIVRAIQSVIAARRAGGVAAQVSERALGPVGAHTGGSMTGALRRTAETEVTPTASRSVIVTDFTPAHTFEHRFTIAFPPEQVFALFGRIEDVAACLPGAFVDAVPSPERVEGGIKVRLGPISAAFRGAASIARDEADRSGRIVGAGADGRSGAQGEIRYRVLPGSDANTSDVALNIGYTLKGPLAQFGRPGLVRDIAARLTADFARNIEARLSGAAPASFESREGINPFRLFLSLLFSRLPGWLKSNKSAPPKK